MKTCKLAILGMTLALNATGANAANFPSKVASTTDATFKKDVLQAKAPVFVDFYATWCGPCKTMAPIVEQLSAQYKGQMKFLRVDVDQNPRVTAKFGIDSVPTFAIFKNGKPVAAASGVTPKAVLSNKIDSSIKL